MLEIRNICSIQTTTAKGLAVLCLTGVWVSLLDLHPTNKSIDGMRRKLEAYFFEKTKSLQDKLTPDVHPENLMVLLGNQSYNLALFLCLPFILEETTYFCAAGQERECEDS